MGKQMNSSTVETLLEIIDDPNLFTRRKIEAAEAILGFESLTMRSFARRNIWCLYLMIATQTLGNGWTP